MANSNREDSLADKLYSYATSAPFRRVLGELLERQAARPFKTLGVLSIFPKEGKSFFSAVLALAYARFLQSRVLLVNAGGGDGEGALLLDLAKCLIDVHREEALALGHDPDRRGKIDIFNVIDESNKRAVLTDFELGGYLRSAEAKYDVILVDCVSLVESFVVDPLVLSRYLDGSLLITSEKSVNPLILNRFQREYGSKLHILGTVYNEHNERAHKRNYLGFDSPGRHR